MWGHLRKAPVIFWMSDQIAYYGGGMGWNWYFQTNPFCHIPYPLRLLVVSWFTWIPIAQAFMCKTALQALLNMVPHALILIAGVITFLAWGLNWYFLMSWVLEIYALSVLSLYFADA